MSGSYASSGFEIENAFDRRAYPAARTKRPGPPPAATQAGIDVLAPREAPIRSRSIAFGLREVSGTGLVALGAFVGPALVKRLDVTVFTMGNNNPQPTVNLFQNTSAYTSLTDPSSVVAVPGSAIFEARIQDDQPATFAVEGGLATSGTTPSGYSYLIDRYIPDPQFFLALVARNPVAQANAMYGMLLVYEGVIVSDFPMILG